MKAKLYKVENTFYLKVGETILGTSSNPNLSASIRYSLSLKNCQEIELGYDLDELIDKYCRGNSKIEDDFIKKGFQKALEVNSDKRFTFKEMVDCWNKALNFQEHKETLGDHMKSLQQTEFSVEIVMGDPIGISDKYTPDTKPKLDENSCLILKRIKE